MSEINMIPDESMEKPKRSKKEAKAEPPASKKTPMKKPAAKPVAKPAAKPAAKKEKPKRTISAEQLQKMKEGRERKKMEMVQAS